MPATTYLKGIILLIVCGFLSAVSAQGPVQKLAPSVRPPAVQQPLYQEYRGLTIGVTAKDVAAKLGEPMSKVDDQEFYTINEKETAQIAYDAAGKVKTISVDYFGGTGAPDYKTVVGPEIGTRPDGSQYKLVRYEAAGIWVSYNRTGGPVVIVTVTIQKI